MTFYSFKNFKGEKIRFFKFMLFLAIFSLVNVNEAMYFMQQDSDVVSKISYGNNEKS